MFKYQSAQHKPFITLLAGALLLAGCASAPEQRTDADAVTVQDAWVKAADRGMTAAFGRLSNSSGTDVRVVSATTAAASRVELHEVAAAGGAMAMRPKEGGFVVPAGAALEMRPGGDHIMLMDLGEPLIPGDDLDIVATFGDGSTLPITAQVRDFPGADEHYAPGAHG